MTMRNCGWFIHAAFMLLLGWSDSRDIKIFGRCPVVIGGGCPDNKFIAIHLYTRQNKDSSQLVQLTDTKDNLESTNFDSSDPNKVIIHGFNAHLYGREIMAIKDEYLDRDDVNVWMVDWTALSTGGVCMPFSHQNCRHVGQCLAQLVSAIQRYEDSPNIHVIASGAGTQVANYLAQNIKKIILKRITGINPPLLLMKSESVEQKLDSGDADFVDIIHTSPFVQHTERIGHVEFYMNPGGIHQPGCKKQKNSFDCDRSRAFEYFAESINSEVDFVAWSCDGYPQFLMGLCGIDTETEIVGDKCSDWARGLYIAYTSKEKPWALGAWNETLFLEKGPTGRSDKLALISSAVRRNLVIVKENTPKALQDLGLYRKLKNNIEDRAVVLKDKSARASVEYGKVMARGIYEHTIGNKQKKNQESTE